MNRLPTWVRQHIVGLRVLLVFTVICGIVYPLVMVGISQLAFHKQANGSLLTVNNKVVGSALLCQEFVNAKDQPLPQYFQSRPSYALNPAVKTDPGCDGEYSSASNLGPTNPVLVKAIKMRQQQIEAFDHVKLSQIPADAVTASGSGMDPGISPANAAIQVDRVAAARHVSPADVMALVKQYTQGRVFGFLGEPYVNVLELNIALDKKYPVSG